MMRAMPIDAQELPRRTKKLLLVSPAARRTPATVRRLRRALTWARRKFELRDKRDWGPGPWQDEPDVVLFTHAGLQCVILRHIAVTGALNGYVVVPPEHPWWGKDRRECMATPQCPLEEGIDFDYMAQSGFPVPPVGSRMRDAMAERMWNCDHTPVHILDAHGGITYGGPLHAPPDWREVGWAFGFDTGHAGDLAPKTEALLRVTRTLCPDPVLEHFEQMKARVPIPFRDTYKDLPYVRHHVEQLAEQLALVHQVVQP